MKFCENMKLVGKAIVFRFIIEYVKGFWPLGSRPNFYMRIFER